MKRENIYVGMRVKLKQSCVIVAWRGKYATAIDQPCEGLEKYATCMIDGIVNAKQVLHIGDIKISDEKPVVGDRIVVVQAKPSQGGKYYENGASGIVSYIDEDGDPKVTFDRGEYDEQKMGGWFVQKSLGQKYAIVRDVEGVK